MGIKANYVIVGDCAPGYLGSSPIHHPERVQDALLNLGLKGLKNRRNGAFDVIASEGSILIGAYEHAVYLAASDEQFSEEFESHIFKNAPALFPSGSTLMVALISSCNLFMYDYFERSERVRQYSGHISKPVMTDFGQPLPEEAEAFNNSILREGQRYFMCKNIFGDVEENSADTYGQELAFQVSRRFFCCHPFHSPENKKLWALEVEQFDL